MKVLDLPDAFKNKGEYDIQKCKFTPITVFTYGALENFLMGDLDEFIANLKQLHSYILSATGYGWGNTHWRVSNISGEEFGFSIYKVGEECEFHLWNHSGHFEVFSADLPKEIPERKKLYAQAVKAMDRYSHGFIRCSECGTEIAIAEAWNRKWFAGVYCQHCWDTKYKALEANTNYN